MTTDEMRRKAEPSRRGGKDARSREVWDVGVEICERLDELLKLLKEPLNCYTKEGQ